MKPYYILKLKAQQKLRRHDIESTYDNTVIQQLSHCLRVMYFKVWDKSNLNLHL